MTSYQRNRWKKLKRMIMCFVATIIICSALVVSVTELTTPFLNQHRVRFESWVSELLKIPVSIGQIAVVWRGSEPALSLHQILLIDEETHQPKVSISHLEIGIAFFRSLFKRKLIIQRIVVDGMDLTIYHTGEKAFQIGELGSLNMQDTSLGQAMHPSVMMAWLFSRPELTLRNINIHYVSLKKQHEKSIMLSELALENDGEKHGLNGQGFLNQDIPTKMTVKASLVGKPQDPEHITAHVDVHFVKVALRQWSKKMNIDGVQFLNGLADCHIKADWNQNHWEDIQSDVQLDKVAFSSDWFEKPLAFDQFTGEFHVKQDADDNWIITAKNLDAHNEDVAGNVDFTLDLPNNNSPTLDLSGHFSVNKAENLAYYFPTKRFPPDLSSWLQAAFLSGQLLNGSVKVQGQLSHFPFGDQSGEFNVTGQVANLDFNYAKDWPLLRQINGVLTFTQNSMIADVYSGQIFGVPVKDIHGVINHLGDSAPAELTVKGAVQTDLADGWNFITNSPLQKNIGNTLKRMQASGPMGLTLALTVPLMKPENTRVIGNIDLKADTLYFSRFKLPLQAISGQLQFTEKDLSGKGIQARLLNEPVTLQFSTLHTANDTQTRVDVVSKMNIASLQQWLKITDFSLISGSADYAAQFYLSQASQGKSPLAHLVIHSDLRGIAVKLPAPYGKKETEVRSTDCTLSFNDADFKITGDYAHLLKVALRFAKANNEFRLEGGEVHLGNGEASLRDRVGLAITGTMSQLDWKTWQSFVPAKQTNSLVNAVDIHAGTMNFYGQKLTEASLKATINNDTVLAHVDSREVRGEVNVSPQSIQAEFQRFDVTFSPEGVSATMDPKKWPPIEFKSHEVRYAGINWGNVVFRSSPASDGVTINELSLQTPLWQINAVGEWSLSGLYHSHLRGSVNTSHLTEALRMLGMNSNSLNVDVGKAFFDLRWQSALYHPELSTMAGNLGLTLGPGSITQLSDSNSAKLGLGRLLNILSIQTLTRTLSSGFRNLSGTGYTFDFMKADFSLQDGDAYTQNMRFDGPVARIDILGRIGLEKKDLNIKLGVTPYVTGSLPVVAAIAGGPVVGVATWVVDKVISGEVGHLITYQYNVTGSWDNPQWRQVSAMPSKL